MNREEKIERIYNTLMEEGKITSKGDILSDNQLEDKVFTKRLEINKTLGEGVNTVNVVFVTLTSNDFSFRDTTSADIRINTKNTREQWCNIFANEATDDMLELVESTVCQ